MLMLSGILPVLSTRFPEAEIDLLCGSRSCALAETFQRFTRIFTLDHAMLNRRKLPASQKWLRFFRDLLAILPRLRRERYDLCLCLRPFGWNLITLARLTGAQFIAGHATGGCGPLLDAVAQWRTGAHTVEHHP
jgi:ADP-heptose:LPS heptosyltransferase